MENLPLFTGFYASQVVQDVFHQQYLLGSSNQVQTIASSDGSLSSSLSRANHEKINRIFSFKTMDFGCWRVTTQDGGDHQDHHFYNAIPYCHCTYPKNLVYIIYVSINAYRIVNPKYVLNTWAISVELFPPKKNSAQHIYLICQKKNNWNPIRYQSNT